MADIIKVEHLSYVYNPGMPNAVTALDDVSFTVEEGDFVGIIGATGSGKSTLITHMNGLNKPTSGKIYIDGRDLWADPEKIRAGRGGDRPPRARGRRLCGSGPGIAGAQPL